MIIKTVTPINIKKREIKLWLQNKEYTAKAYIFSNKLECLELFKKIINKMHDMFDNMYVYIIVKSNYEDLNINKVRKALSIIRLKKGGIFKINLKDIKYDIDFFLELWGESDRIQFFFSEFDNDYILKLIKNISSKYRNSYKSYFKVIKLCRYIISDTGDGDEFELIKNLKLKKNRY